MYFHRKMTKSETFLARLIGGLVAFVSFIAVMACFILCHYYFNRCSPGWCFIGLLVVVPGAGYFYGYYSSWKAIDRRSIY